MAADNDLTLANLGQSVWDFVRMPYRAPDENRIAGGRPAEPNFADRFVGNTLISLATLPQRAFQSAQTYADTGYYDPAPIVEAALTATTGGMPFAMRGTVGSAGGKMVPPKSSLPMDDASRLGRADAMKYDRRPFYRGDRTGDVPREFPDGAFFSRDRDTAAGVARLGGRSAPEEYRLNLQKAFSDHAPVTAETYARIVAAARSSDPKFAAELVDQIARGRSADWLMEFARRNPQMTVARSGALLRQAIKMNALNERDLFRRAGFDTLDFGTDVLKLGGDGIRSKNAMFDPSKAHLPDIMAALPIAAVGLGGAVSSYPTQD